MKAIEVEGLVKEFPTGFRKPPHRVINNLSFTIEKGENVAIIGPNGCGKTTLLKAIATIYLPDDGTIRLFEQDVFKNRARARKAFAFVSPALNFQAKLTLRQTVEYFAKVLGKHSEVAIPFLKRMGVYHMWDSRLEGFSEGQKAMVRLAIGLIKEPRVIMLDEVMANLDVSKREQVIQSIQELEEFSDLTVVMVDHDPHVVDRLCDRIIILREGGTLHSFSTVEELMAQMRYTYSVEVTLKSDMSDDELNRMGATFRRYATKVRYFAQDAAEVEELTHNILANTNKVLEFNTSSVSLKDVYYFMMEGDLSRLA